MGPDGHKLLLMASKEAKLGSEEGKVVFLGALLWQRVYFAEWVASSLAVLPCNGVEACRVLKVIDRLNIVSLLELE